MRPGLKAILSHFDSDPHIFKDLFLHLQKVLLIVILQCYHVSEISVVLSEDLMDRLSEHGHEFFTEHESQKVLVIHLGEAYLAFEGIVVNYLLQVTDCKEIAIVELNEPLLADV